MVSATADWLEVFTIGGFLCVRGMCLCNECQTSTSSVVWQLRISSLSLKAPPCLKRMGLHYGPAAVLLAVMSTFLRAAGEMGDMMYTMHRNGVTVS